MTTIETDRLSIRPPILDDADFYTALENNPKVKRFVGGQSGITADGYRQRIIANQKSADISILTVTQRDSDRVIGRAGILELNNREIEVHCVLAEEYWGQGFGFEIVNSLIKHCEHFFPGKLIVGKVSPDNAASIKIIKSLGFRETEIVQSGSFDNGFRKFILKNDYHYSSAMLILRLGKIYNRKEIMAWLKIKFSFKRA